MTEPTIDELMGIVQQADKDGSPLNPYWTHIAFTHLERLKRLEQAAEASREAFKKICRTSDYDRHGMSEIAQSALVALETALKE